MNALTWSEILASFDPIDRPDVLEPDLAAVAWGTLDYFAWKNPSGHRAYMCVPLRERSVGLVFRLYGAATRAGMCDLCVGIDREHGTATALVDSWKRPRSSYGIHVCSNFDCSAGIRGLRYADQMGETITTGQRAERLQANLERFVRSVTGLAAVTP